MIINFIMTQYPRAESGLESFIKNMLTGSVAFPTHNHQYLNQVSAPSILWHDILVNQELNFYVSNIQNIRMFDGLKNNGFGEDEEPFEFFTERPENDY